MIDVGKYNTLTILRETSIGLYLAKDFNEDVLLPNKYCPKTFQLDDDLEVFVYLDNAGRKIATNLKPKILLKQFAYLGVVDINDVGAFLDWGLEKHLLLPYSEQREEIKLGHKYMVYMGLDDRTNRLYASNRCEKFLQNRSLTIGEGEPVELLILRRTELGYLVIIENRHSGMIYHNEIFQELRIGQQIKGYVKKIRADKKIDISLQPQSYDNFIDAHSALILRLLAEANNFIGLNDKSLPQQIYAKFGISKKAFKKTIGTLYKKGYINISEYGIELINKKNS